MSRTPSSTTVTDTPIKPVLRCRRWLPALLVFLSLVGCGLISAGTASADTVFSDGGDVNAGSFITMDFSIDNGAWTNSSQVLATITESGDGSEDSPACSTDPLTALNEAADANSTAHPPGLYGSVSYWLALSPGANQPGCAVVFEENNAEEVNYTGDDGDFSAFSGGSSAIGIGTYTVYYDPTSSAQLTPSLDVSSGVWYTSAPDLSAYAATEQGGDLVNDSCTLTDLSTQAQESFSSSGWGAADATSADTYVGQQTLQCYASNAAGTTSPTTSVTFGVDSVTPDVTLSGPATGQWYSTGQSVTVSATAGPLGLASFTCDDNGTPLSASSTTLGIDSETATYPVVANGVNSVSCSATGGNGLVGTQTTTIDIDTTAPSVTFSGATFNQWVGSGQTVTATAVVGSSGLSADGMTCTPSGGGTGQQVFQSGSGSMTLDGSGTYTITCTLTNGAGVGATVTSQPVEIDEQTPTVSFSGVDGSTTSASDAVALSSGGTLTVTGSDPAPSGDSSWDGGSGIQSVACQLNGGGYATVAGGSYSLPINGTGQYEVDCRATNGVGTVSTTSSYYVEINTATISDGQSAIVDGGQSAYSNGPSQTAWYRDAQTLTVTASLPDGDTVASIACTGAGVNDSDPNTSGTRSETVGVNVSAPGGTLVCTATDTAGNSYPLGSYVLNIDDTPPTGYFIGADAASPALIRAAVADDQSGVASVTINVLCLSGACLDAVQANTQDASTALATTYDPGSGYWEATIPDDGSLADGDYELIANTTDGAGNTGQVTEFVDGATAGISLPARVVTTLDATVTAGDDQATSSTVTDTGVPTQVASTAHAARGHASTTNPKNEVCTVKAVKKKKAHGKRVTKLEKVCVKIKQVKALTLSYGQKSTISGLLVDQASDTPITDAQVQIEQTVSGSSTPTPVTTVTTNSLGEWKLTLPAGPNRVVEALYDGTPLLRSAGAQITEHSRGTSTLKASGRLVAGRTATLSGTVKGGYIPPDGVQVQLWYTIKGSHVAFAPWTTTIHTTSKGKWKFTFRLAKYTAGSTYEFQVRLDTQYGWGYLKGKSKILTRKIS